MDWPIPGVHARYVELVSRVASAGACGLVFEGDGTIVHHLFSVRVPKVMRLSLPDLDVRSNL